MITDDTVYQAMFHMQNGEFAEAAKGLEDYVSRDPKQIQVMGELCYCYVELKRYEDLEKLAGKALLIAQNRGNIDNIGRFYGYLGKSFYYRKIYEPAVRYYNLAIANKPGFMPNYQELACCYFDLNQFQKSVDEFKKIVEKDPEYAKEYEIEKKINIVYGEWVKKDSVRFLCVDAFSAQNDKKDYELAKLEYNNVIKLDPENTMALYGLFSIAQEEGKTRLAIELGEKLFELLKKIENIDESTLKAAVYIGLSILYDKIDDIETSAEYGQWFYTTKCFDDADEAMKKGDLKEALKYYEKAIETRPDSYDALEKAITFLMATDIESNRILQYIKQGLEVAIEQNDDERQARFLSRAGFYFALKKDFESSVKYYSMAATKTSNVDYRLKMYHSMARIYIVHGNLQDVMSLLELCNDLISRGAMDVYDIPSMIIKVRNMLDKNSDINRANDHYNLGAKLFNEQKFDEAIKEIELSLDLIPQDLDAMNILTRAYFLVGRQEDACDVAEEGISICMRDHDFRYVEPFAYNVGNYNYNKGNYKKALKYYNYALKMNPSDEDYIYFVNACKKHLGEE